MTLPTIEPRRQDEPAMYYGARVLQFLIEHDITATLTDEDLEQALHAAIYATARADLLPAVYARISAAKHRASATLAGRARVAQEAQNEPATSHPPIGAAGTAPVPLAPLPKVNPPAGQYAEPLARRPEKAEVTF